MVQLLLYSSECNLREHEDEVHEIQKNIMIFFPSIYSLILRIFKECFYILVLFVENKNNYCDFNLFLPPEFQPTDPKLFTLYVQICPGWNMIHT